MGGARPVGSVARTAGGDQFGLGVPQQRQALELQRGTISHLKFEISEIRLITSAATISDFNDLRFQNRAMEGSMGRVQCGKGCEPGVFWQGIPMGGEEMPRQTTAWLAWMIIRCWRCAEKRRMSRGC